MTKRAVAKDVSSSTSNQNFPIFSTLKKKMIAAKQDSSVRGTLDKTAFPSPTSIENNKFIIFSIVTGHKRLYILSFTGGYQSSQPIYQCSKNFQIVYIKKPSFMIEEICWKGKEKNNLY